MNMLENLKVEKDISGKPKDTITKTTKIPRAKIFKLTEESTNEEYEKLMLEIQEGKVEVSNSSGHWNEGVYRVQVHYFDVVKEKVQREDTDYESIADTKVSKEGEGKKPIEKDIESEKELVEAHNAAFTLETHIDKKRKQPKKLTKKEESSG